MSDRKVFAMHMFSKFRAVVLFSMCCGFGSLLVKGSVVPHSIFTQEKSVQRDVQTLYDNLVTEGYFETAGIKNAGVTFDFSQDRELLLYLVEWLVQRHDEQSTRLLTKINNLFYLKFHQVLTRIDGQRLEKQDLLIQDLRTLFMHRVGTVFPFQTMITKTMLQLAVITADNLTRDDYQASVLLVLHQAQESFIAINNSLAVTMNNSLVDNRVDERVICRLIDGFERHTLTPEKESAFVGVGNKVITAVIVVASIVIVMAVGYYFIKKIMNRAVNNTVQIVDYTVEHSRDVLATVNNVAGAINGINDRKAPVLGTIKKVSKALHKAGVAVHNFSEKLPGIKEAVSQVAETIDQINDEDSPILARVDNVTGAIERINDDHAPVLARVDRVLGSVEHMNNVGDQLRNSYIGRLFGVSSTNPSGSQPAPLPAASAASSSSSSSSLSAVLPRRS